MLLVLVLVPSTRSGCMEKWRCFGVEVACSKLKIEKCWWVLCLMTSPGNLVSHRKVLNHFLFPNFPGVFRFKVGDFTCNSFTHFWEEVAHTIPFSSLCFCQVCNASDDGKNSNLPNQTRLSSWITNLCCIHTMPERRERYIEVWEYVNLKMSEWKNEILSGWNNAS